MFSLVERLNILKLLSMEKRQIQGNSEKHAEYMKDKERREELFTVSHNTNTMQNKMKLPGNRFKTNKRKYFSCDT